MEEVGLSCVCMWSWRGLAGLGVCLNLCVYVNECVCVCGGGGGGGGRGGRVYVHIQFRGMAYVPLMKPSLTFRFMVIPHYSVCVISLFRGLQFFSTSFILKFTQYSVFQQFLLCAEIP